MNNEEKILELLTQISGRMDSIDTRMDQMQADISDLKGGQTQLQDDIAHINARLELDIGKRLDALAEGQNIIEKRLDTLDDVKEMAEEAKDKVDVIHAVVTQHSLSISELKQVQ